MLAADQRITWWAHELRKAGLDGGMDQLRARACLDLLLGQDSRPRPVGPRAADPLPVGPRAADPQPAGFAGRITLTAPLDTLTRLANRPGELAGLGPVDPWLARDLATAAAHNPKTTWCVTVTDQDGHAIGHGCARPEPKGRRKRAGPGPPSTTSRLKRAGAPACVTPARSAGMTTGSSSTQGGRSTSSPTAPSAGPPRPGGTTPPNPPGIPSKLALNPGEVCSASMRGSVA